MSGGTLMVTIGVLYLVFEKKLLSKSKLAGDSITPADNTLSRSLVGIQVSYHRIGTYKVADSSRSASLSWL
jgi:hypothetical protein